MNGKYLVYRIYTKEERPDIEERSVLYGWSKSKSIVKAFNKQRNPSKYRIIKMSDNDIIRMYSETLEDQDNMIDFIKVRSAKTHEELYLFMTRNEMRETEKNIQKMFMSQASFDDVKDLKIYISMLLNFQNYYGDALYFIGYRPAEVDILFESADWHDSYCNIDKVEEEIDNAYDGICEIPQEVYGKVDGILGLSVIEDVANKIYYSVESFIKVMKDDM